MNNRNDNVADDQLPGYLKHVVTMLFYHLYHLLHLDHHQWRTSKRLTGPEIIAEALIPIYYEADSEIKLI